MMSDVMTIFPKFSSFGGFYIAEKTLPSNFLLNSPQMFHTFMIKVFIYKQIVNNCKAFSTIEHLFVSVICDLYRFEKGNQ